MVGFRFITWYYYFHNRACEIFKRSYRATLWHLYQFYLELLYFMFVSVIGFLALVLLDRRKPAGANRIANLDLFFMSVSATTASSLASIDMEDFTNSQFWVLIFVMFVGGEIFLSALTLIFKSINFGGDHEFSSETRNTRIFDKAADIEPAVWPNPTVINNRNTDHGTETDVGELKIRSMKCLASLALGFYMFVNIAGSLTVLCYFKVIPSARAVLEGKGLNMVTFSVFATVSSFVNCGFLPNNENMVAFVGDSGFLLMSMAQILAGNTLFPPCLTLILWAFRKLIPLKEFDYLWKRGQEAGYTHLFPWKTSVYLTLSNVGFTVLQFIMFGLLQWGSAAGMSLYHKVIAGIFQSANARHAGEMAFDLSSFSPSLLVVYMIMMYLPPYTFFLPLSMDRPRSIKDADSIDGNEKKKRRIGEVSDHLLLPPAAYIVVFVVFLCLTERNHFREDPLNFNVFSIAFEVVSAYGNVGLTMGYSCQRLHKLSSSLCKDTSASLSGRLSLEGKIIMLVVMFFGKLKRFAQGGKAWVTLP